MKLQLRMRYVYATAFVLAIVSAIQDNPESGGRDGLFSPPHSGILRRSNSKQKAFKDNMLMNNEKSSYNFYKKRRADDRTQDRSLLGNFRSAKDSHSKLPELSRRYLHRNRRRTHGMKRNAHHTNRLPSISTISYYNEVVPKRAQDDSQNQASSSEIKLDSLVKQQRLAPKASVRLMTENDNESPKKVEFYNRHSPMRRLVRTNLKKSPRKFRKSATDEKPTEDPLSHITDAGSFVEESSLLQTMENLLKVNNATVDEEDDEVEENKDVRKKTIAVVKLDGGDVDVEEVSETKKESEMVEVMDEHMHAAKNATEVTKVQANGDETTTTGLNMINESGTPTSQMYKTIESSTDKSLNSAQLDKIVQKMKNVLSQMSKTDKLSIITPFKYKFSGATLSMKMKNSSLFLLIELPLENALGSNETENPPLNRQERHGHLVHSHVFHVEAFHLPTINEEGIPDEDWTPTSLPDELLRNDRN